jgi:hypothetical protein
MRTVYIRSLSIAAAVILTFAGSATAQDKPSALLNTLEVRQLVARAEPADNLRLSAHFNALGDRYAAEAKRHASMSQSFVGNPSRALAAKASTPAEHHALEEYFRTLARRHEVDAKEHATFAGALRGTRIEHASISHSRLAELARDAAKEANEAAEMHKQLATVAR